MTFRPSENQLRATRKGRLMKSAIGMAVIVLALGCSQAPAPPAAQNAPADEAGAAASLESVEAPSTATIKPLTSAELHKLLDTRLDSQVDPLFRNADTETTFGQFANMFLVSSRLQIGYGIGLMTPDAAVRGRQVRSPFPATYKPKVSEFLDSIALQTFSQWKYDPTSKYFHSDVPGETESEGLAMFEFLPAKREKPFQVTLADGWKAVDHGNWMMYVPPSFLVGLDIYEMGTYSQDGRPADASFRDWVRREVALEWTRRVGQHVAADEFQRAKVGAYEALFFEFTANRGDGHAIHWRQWVFMVDDACYAAISSILPELDDTIFPDVEKMLASFKMREP